MSKEKIICADVIARLGSKFVIAERLGSVQGLALPGGKQDPGETLSETIEREMWEEVGLSLSITGVLGTYAEEGRDPRGDYVSTVFMGVAYGSPREEVGKTKIILMEKVEIFEAKELFVFDHFQILEQYFRLVGKKAARNK